MAMPEMMVADEVFDSGTTNRLRQIAIMSLILFLNGVRRFYGWRMAAVLSQHRHVLSPFYFSLEVD